MDLRDSFQCRGVAILRINKGDKFFPGAAVFEPLLQPGSLVPTVTITNDGQSEIDVQCSNGIGYSIALNGGLTGAVDPTQRKMSFGANTITYGLYQNVGHTSPWGSSSGVNVAAGTGTSLSQPFPVYGHVPPQATPPLGTYSDTIVVSVAY